MDERSLDLAIGALDRFRAFVETLTPDELDAVAALGEGQDGDVEGFGLTSRSVAVGGETSFEYLIGLSGNLLKADVASNIAAMRDQLDALKAAQGRAAWVRWPP
jgi:hypothetical protein